MSCRIFSVIFVVFLACAAVSARADDLFTLSANSTSGPPASATASGHSLVDLVQDLIESRSEFLSLQNNALSASLRYAGLNNALQFTRSADGTQATINIPSTGFTRTFVGANESDVNHQIKEFMIQEGADEYAKFLKVVGEQTTVSAIDGNPLASTAMVADDGFYRFGLLSGTPSLGREGVRIPGGLMLDFRGGSDNSDQGGANLDGYFVDVALTGGIPIGDRVALAFGGTFRYRNIQDADVYEGDIQIGLPILIIAPEPDNNGNGWSWQVTPAAVGAGGVSVDTTSGGIVLGGQFTSSLAYRAAPWTFILGNQFGFYEGIPVDISSYEWKTDTHQQILKNGVQVVRELGPGAFVDAGIVYTNFLQDAAVQDYWSPLAGIGIRFGEASGLRIGYRGDFGDDFTSNGGEIDLFFAF